VIVDKNTDHRLLVLILIAAAILASGWRSATPEPQASSYFWADGALIRTNGSSSGQGVPLAANLSCAATPPEAARFFGLPLPINRADQQALMALPGIGPKLSENILKYRAEQGGITGPNDLIKVNGIGPKRLARLTPLLCFDQAR
jgi:DNA uptake protein ComE-like DNA-binding protein